MPYLEFLSESRPVGPGVLTIGSGTESAWRIRDHDLLPVHVIVAPASGGEALVTRARADAVVLINGQEIGGAEKRIRFGDIIQLNSAKLIYRQLAKEAERAGAFLRDVRRGRIYKLQERATIGRDSACEVLVQEPDVSRHHALVWHTGDRWFIEPIGRAYVLVNGTRIIAPSPLAEGGEVTVGKTVLRFTTAASAEATTAEAKRYHGDNRAARMQTMYVTTVEMHERAVKGTQRRAYIIIAIVIAVAAVVAMLLG